MGLSAGRPPKNGSIVEPFPTLSDLGINKLQSHRCQLIFGIPEYDFEEHLEHTLSKPEELTSAGVVRLAKRLLAAEEAETPPPPEGKYNVIVIDPPWEIAKMRRTHASIGTAAYCPECKAPRFRKAFSYTCRHASPPPVSLPQS